MTMMMMMIPEHKVLLFRCNMDFVAAALMDVHAG